MMGLDPLFVARISILLIALAAALVLARKHGGLSVTAPPAIGWATALLAVLSLASDGQAGVYLIASALGFGLGARR